MDMGRGKYTGYDYDAIIIGSGMGGLVTGTHLARAGAKVLVCEQHFQPGGYFTSFKRKGYTFDGGIQGCEDGGMFFNLFRELGIFDQLELKRTYFALATPEFFLPLKTVSDVGTFYRKLIDVYPHEANGLEHILKEAEACCNFMLSFSKLPNPMFTSWRNVFTEFPKWFSENREAIKYMGDFSRNMSIPMEDYFKQHVSDPDLLNFLGQMSYSGSPTSFGLLFFTFLMDYHHPMGGVQVIPDLMAQYIEKLGGQIKYRTLVEEILIENGKAQGVRTQAGETFRAPFVISNCDARHTYMKMLPSAVVPESYKEGLRQSEVSESFFSVFLGVDIPPEKIPLHGYSHVLYFPDLKGIPAEDYKRSDNNDVYARAPLEININTIHDPSLAPKGKSTIVLQSAAFMEFADHWGTKNRKRTKRYKDLKEKVSTHLIATAEQLIPGLSKKIDFKIAATPYTFERYTLNSGGASAGWTFNQEKSFNSGMKAFSGFNPPVKNLYQVGHWAMSPGGAPSGIITGKVVANIVKQRLRWGI
jgi:phytoene dehydrogenase-like protein